MLIGKSSKRPNLAKVRQIKRALLEVLPLPADTLVMVTELACIEEGCAPLETVIALLRPGEPQVQHKLHKAIAEIEIADIVLVSMNWGFDIQPSAFEPFFT